MPVFKKIFGWLAYVLVLGGIVVAFVRSLLGSGLEHGAKDAAPLVAMGSGALIFAAVGEKFTWARTEIPMPMWLGRLFFAILGGFFLFGAWGIGHQ